MKASIVLAAAPGAQPDAQPVGVDVVGAEDVAGAVAAVVVGALALGPAFGRPARAGGRAQADRPHLVEATTDAVRRGTRVRAPAPAPSWSRSRGRGWPSRCGCAGTTGPPRPAPCPRCAGLITHDPLLGQMRGQPRQRPARQRHPLGVGTGTGHADDPLTLISRDPAGSPAPVVRAQRVEPALVELVDHLAHMTRVGQPLAAICAADIPTFEANTIDARCTRRRMLRTLRPAASTAPPPHARAADKHLRGTHHHLHGRDTSQFAANSQFPVKHSEKAH